ncbi:uncharacterized protein LOC134531315 [Bacillus rossius redtenbacheri]|uniref:uncharacterized protein LOC134531315 n=1 Tax=Bacillus rossius redtenbacheri TaxID=93214 RepID=UPI002FDCA566
MFLPAEGSPGGNFQASWQPEPSPGKPRKTTSRNTWRMKNAPVPLFRIPDIPMHVTMLSFLLIAADRHRYTMDPGKPRMPAFVCCMGTWLLAVCIVLPYPIYTTYLDLGTYMKDHFEGVGICAVNLVDDMQEYMRGLFIIMYVLPLAVISYLYVRSSRELKVQEGPAAIMMHEARSRQLRSRSSASGHSRSASAFCFTRPVARCSSVFPKAWLRVLAVQLFSDVLFRSEDNHGSFRASGERSGNYDLYEAELDVSKEKRTQKYLITMVTVYAICLCPLMVLRVAKLALIETYENSGHFDITFTLFVWVAFLPTCTTPCLFASWRMSRMQKERLRGYLRFSNRRRGRPQPEEAAAGKTLGNVAFIRQGRPSATPGGGADLASS